MAFTSTEEERRALRQEQRNLYKKMVKFQHEMEDPSLENLEKLREANNVLFKRVDHTREAVLDSDNTSYVSTRAARQVDRFLEVPRYDASRLTQKLRSKCPLARGGFDWGLLGVEVGACFNAVPTRVSFLLGPLQADYVPKERKQRSPRKRSTAAEDDEEEEKPEEVKQTERNRNADALSAVERNIKVLGKTLKKRVEQEKKRQLEQIEKITDPEEKDRAKRRRYHCAGDVDAVKYLCNPKSFTQTVENMFHLSFLVKKGNVGVDVRSKELSDEVGGAGPGPVIREHLNDQEEMHHVPPRQSILAFTMRDWKDLCKAYEVEQSDIPHRTGSAHTRPVSN